MSEHIHEWKVIVKIAEGESVDSYEECRCQAIKHTYTYAPSNIEHVTMIAESALAWTRGFAYGLLFGSEPAKRRVEPAPERPCEACGAACRFDGHASLVCTKGCGHFPWSPSTTWQP